MLPFCTEQRWSEGNDSQAATDVLRKDRRKSDVTDEMIDENAGVLAWNLLFTNIIAVF